LGVTNRNQGGRREGARSEEEENEGRAKVAQFR